MQDRYTGDLGDFGKYGLLRVLTGATQEGGSIPLGVVWYLTPDRGNSGDGRQTGYLRLEEKKARQFTRCDPELYRNLQRIVDSDEREVAAIERSRLLPESTAYHPGVLDPRSVGRNGGTLREARAHAREEWHRDALEVTEECGIVFLDPDNGLETGRTEASALQGSRYAYYEELRPYLERKQTLVVYQHLNRSARAPQQIFLRQREIYERLGRRAFAMRYHRGSPRAFIIIPQGPHRAAVIERARGMLASPWGRHFSMVG